MAQATRTVNDIIISAFYLIGEADPDESIPGGYLAEGLDLLNQLIDQFSGDEIYIPYQDTINFNLVANKAQYTVSNVVPADITANRIVSLEYCNLTYQDISRPIKIVTRTEILSHYRNENSVVRPSYVLLEKEVQQSILTFYSTPDTSYECIIKAKVYLNEFELFTPIRNIPPNFQRFMKYALGRELLSYYPSGNWTDRNEDEYNRMYRDLQNSNDIDLMVRPSGLLRREARHYRGSSGSIWDG